MKYLSNAFSLNMVAQNGNVQMFETTLEKFKDGLLDDSVQYKSVVGHQDTADLMAAVLGVDVAFNRESVTLNPYDMLFVCQFSGPRLPEGTKILPEGATFRYFLIFNKGND